MNRMYAIAALGLLSAAAGADGAFITANLMGISPALTVEVAAFGGGFVNVYDGRYNWFRTGGDAAAPIGTFTSYCIEITQHVSLGGTYNFEPVPTESAPLPAGVLAPMGIVKADQLAELFGSLGFNAFTDPITAQQAAAIQIAVWEIVYEVPGNPLDVSGGNIHFQNGGAIADAQALLNTIDGVGPRFTSLYAISSPDVQDQLVPTPGALALVGLAGLTGLRRRRA